MSAILSSVFGAGAQLMDNNGNILAGGKIFTYLAGSTSPAATWTDSTQLIQNANPIVLNAYGRMTNEMWLALGTSYKFVVTDSTGNQQGSVLDNIPGINAGSVTQSEWVAGPTPAYVSTSSFTVPGNLTATYAVGRRIQFFVSGGTYYATISTSTYNGTALTTVVIAPDSISLDSSLSGVSYGFLNSTPSSVPNNGGATLAGNNTWTGSQTFTNSLMKLLGSSTGVTTFTSANSSATNYTITFPAVTATLLYNGGPLGAPVSGNFSTGTFTWPAFTGLFETKASISASSIDVTTGNVFTKTISGTTTFTVTGVPATGTVASFILELTNAGAYTVNWWSGVKWAAGTAPTLTNSGVDLLGFYTYDGGTTWRGVVLCKDSR